MVRRHSVEKINNLSCNYPHPLPDGFIQLIYRRCKSRYFYCSEKYYNYDR